MNSGERAKTRPLRREPTYLSVEVFKACWLIGQAQSGTVDEHGLSRTVTADEVADTLLYETIKEKHREVFKYLKQIEKSDKAMIDQLARETA